MKELAPSAAPSTRRRLLDAGIDLMRIHGFNGTTVEDICQTAGVTKGGFFHYFDSKDDVANAALELFNEEREKLFAEAAFRQVVDPLERVFARLDFEKELIESASPQPRGCLAGMLAQELAASRKEFRGACYGFFTRRVDDFAADLAAAKAVAAPLASFDPKSVATFYVTIMQGSHILAKASGDTGVRVENLEHYRTYLQGLFGIAESRGKKRKPAAAVAG